jgi:hypothetical protein
MVWQLAGTYNLKYGNFRRRRKKKKKKTSSKSDDRKKKKKKREKKPEVYVISVKVISFRI